MRGVVDDGQEPAVRLGAQRDVLHGLRAAANGREHLPARQHQLDRPPDLSRRHRGKPGVGPGAQPSAKTAADERADDLHVVMREPEDARRRFGDIVRELVGIVERQLVAVPGGDGREQSERIVRLRRGRVLLLDADRRRGQRSGSVAPGVVRFPDARLRRERRVERGPQIWFRPSPLRRSPALAVARRRRWPARASRPQPWRPAVRHSGRGHPAEGGGRAQATSARSPICGTRFFRSRGAFS